MWLVVFLLVILTTPMSASCPTECECFVEQMEMLARCENFPKDPGNLLIVHVEKCPLTSFDHSDGIQVTFPVDCSVVEIDSPLYPGKIIVKPFASSISDAGFLSIDDEVEEKEAASDDGNTNLLGLKVGLPCVIVILGGIVLIILKRLGKLPPLPACCTVRLRWPFAPRVNFTYNQFDNSKNVIITGELPNIEGYPQAKAPKIPPRRNIAGKSRKELPNSVSNTTYAAVHTRPENLYNTAIVMEANSNEAGASNV